ncbi:hypothetical protein AHAS_Ahas15G0225900 [Arachis hypogaea]
MVGLVGNYKGVHHIHCLDAHLGMALAHSTLVGVGCHENVYHNHGLGMHHKMVVALGTLEEDVAERVDQILVAPPIFDCPNLDACSHFSFHSLQHKLNQTHSQRGVNS